MIIKSKQLKSLFSFIAVIFMVCLTAIACKNKPTQAADFNIADPDVKPEPQPNNPAYDNKLIDYRTVKGADPVVVSFGDKGENLLLVYENDSELYYKASLNGGLKFTKEGILGKRISDKGGTASRLASPVVFARGNRITVVASEKGTFGGTYNFPVQPTTKSRLMKIQGTMDATTGEIAWDSTWQDFGVDVGSFAAAQMGEFYNQYATFTGAGKGTASDKFVLPIAVMSKQQYTAEFGFVMAYSSDGKNWSLGTKARYVDAWRANTKYMQTKVFKVNGDSVDLLARPRWNNPVRIGKFSLNYARYEYIRNFSPDETSVFDAQSVFETAIHNENGQTYTYIINGRGNDSDIRLAKFRDETLNGAPEREIIISSKGRAGSVAIIGDGSIATFTDEGGELVYRRFTQKYFETQDKAGVEVAQ